VIRADLFLGVPARGYPSPPERLARTDRVRMANPTEIMPEEAAPFVRIADGALRLPEPVNNVLCFRDFGGA